MRKIIPLFTFTVMPLSCDALDIENNLASSPSISKEFGYSGIRESLTSARNFSQSGFSTKGKPGKKG